MILIGTQNGIKLGKRTLLGFFCPAVISLPISIEILRRAFLITILFLAGCQSQRKPDVSLEVRAKVLEHFHKIYVWNKAIEEYEAERHQGNP